MSEQRLPPKAVKLGASGSLTIPREMLRRLGLEKVESTLFLFLKGRRLTVLTEEEVAEFFPDLLD